jgi:hypothetical protein
VDLLTVMGFAASSAIVAIGASARAAQRERESVRFIGPPEA